MIDAAGTAQDASSHPLTRQEILQLIGPIVPEQARRRLPQETSVDFDYASSSGAYKVTILRNGTEIAVSFVPDPNGVRCRREAAPAAPGQSGPHRRRQRRRPRLRRPAAPPRAPPPPPVATAADRDRRPRAGSRRSIGCFT